MSRTKKNTKSVGIERRSNKKRKNQEAKIFQSYQEVLMKITLEREVEGERSGG